MELKDSYDLDELKETIDKLFDKVIDGPSTHDIEIKGNTHAYQTYTFGPLDIREQYQLKEVVLDMMKDKAKEYATIVWRRTPSADMISNRISGMYGKPGAWKYQHVDSWQLVDTNNYDINFRCVFIK